VSRFAGRGFVPCAALCAFLGISGCGGVPGNAVVQVGGSAITRVTFNHWMEVAFASRSTGAPGKPIVPEPPSYTACVAHLAATSAKPPKGRSKPTTAQLKAECAAQYQASRQQVLGFLISADWLIGEAPSLGIKLTDAEVRRRFVTLEKQEFPTSAKFEKFLASTRYTVSDLLLRVKLAMLQQKIEQRATQRSGKITPARISRYYNENKSHFGHQTLAQAQASIKRQLTAQGQQTALAAFVKEFQRRWKAKTDCRAGFVMQDCKQYKAPKAPAATATERATP
jgi:foldase protein PrsA